MAEFDPNFTRLKTALILFLLVFFIYACEIIVLSGDTDTTETENIIDDMSEVGQDYDAPELDIFGTFGGAAKGVVQFFIMFWYVATFSFPSIPAWMQGILLFVTIPMLATAIYLFLDVIYAIVKALPFT